MKKYAKDSTLSTGDYATNLQEISAGIYATVTALYAIYKIVVAILHSTW